jgi:hypothetical protein
MQLSLGSVLLTGNEKLNNVDISKLFGVFRHEAKSLNVKVCDVYIVTFFFFTNVLSRFRLSFRDHARFYRSWSSHKSYLLRSDMVSSATCFHVIQKSCQILSIMVITQTIFIPLRHGQFCNMFPGHSEIMPDSINHGHHTNHSYSVLMWSFPQYVSTSFRDHARFYQSWSSHKPYLFRSDMVSSATCFHVIQRFCRSWSSHKPYLFRSVMVNSATCFHVIQRSCQILLIMVITETIFIPLRHDQFCNMYPLLLLDHYEVQIRLLHA